MDEQGNKKTQFFWKINLKNFSKIWYDEKRIKPKGSKFSDKVVVSSELKQLNVLAYILQNIHPTDNTFILTYEKIADKTNVSTDTVVRIMRRLGEMDFIRKLQNGVYMVNPYILMWGPESKRGTLYDDYKAAKKLGKSDKKEKTGVSDKKKKSDKPDSD